MNDKNESLWTIIEARDQAVDRSQQRLAAEHAALVAKEAVIQEMSKALEGLHARHREAGISLLEKEQVIQSQHKSLQELDARRTELARAVEEKEAVIQTMHTAVARLEMQGQVLVKLLDERDQAVRNLQQSVASPESHFLLLKGLQEKEAVIQELSRALGAYRSAYPGLRFVLLPLRLAGAAARFIARLMRNLVAPRLGVLNQHAPREMRLPPHYAKPLAIARPPKISIVTPSFKQAAFIERTLNSVLGQGYPDLEYRVQDGGSTDGTTDILEKHAPRLAGWASRPDRGQAEAINLGFAGTTGDIMAWLNSDDVLLPGALAYVADYMSRHPDVDVVYGHRILIDENDLQIGRWILPAHDDEVLSWADFIPQETLFWRRRIWDKVGGRVDDSFSFAMDWDLILRFREAGARFVRLPRFLAAFRIHPHQKTSAAISEVGFQEMDRLRQRVLGRVPSRAEVGKAVFPYLMRHVANDFTWTMQEKLGLRS